MRSLKKQQSLSERRAPREAVVLERGQHYWVETDTGEFYVPCKLLYDVKDPAQELTLEVHGTRAVLQAPQSAVAGLIPPPAQVTLEKNFNDLVAAVDISEPAILWNLKMRFRRNEIYSAIGPILIAVNPYKKIDNMYGPEMLHKYLHVHSSSNEKDDSLGHADEEPHIWSIARSSYLQLQHSGIRQAIIVSGESGAGKTEATKQCLQFLSSISLSSDRHDSRDAIEERVLDTNPLLESFGNAKTARNNNSSRFGKWLEIEFKRSGGTSEFHMELVGARITQYLLEKSRVVAQARDERNYHIFYQMCTYPEFELGAAENFNFLCLSGATRIPGVDDAADFLETLKSFSDLKFSEEEKNIIFDSLKAILHLGNVTFENGDEAKVPTDGDSRMALSEASSLLRMDLPSLEAALTQRTLSVRGERMHVPNSESAATDDRNALCKEVYGRLFCQIVEQANESLSISSSTDVASSPVKCGTDNLSIGLLDIFGFEIFVENSFEQLCINYANEKLQQYFIEFVLKKEQDVYDAEGIVFDRVTPMDNLDVLSMIESRQGGIFVLLDEELKVPKGSDLSFLKKVETQQTAKSSGRFRRDFRGPQELFEIKHFAGTVTYTVTNFMEKNRDKMHEHLEELLQSSASSLFRDTMLAHRPGGAGSPAPLTSPKGKSSNQTSGTIVSRFSKQLLDLMGLLGASQPHFVKCVKPNNSKSADLVDTDLVLRQLRYSGVLEAVKIRKSGYPVRMSHKEFSRVYRVISGEKPRVFRGMDDDKACQLIISRLSSKSEVLKTVKLGRTLVFYRPEASNAMETERFDMAYRALIRLQARRRMHIGAARAGVLADARRQLCAAMNVGEEQLRCNTDAIIPLDQAIATCEELHMICYVLEQARSLSERLKLISICKEKMRVLVASHDTFTDIIGYHEDMTACIDDAIEFGLKTPLMTQAKSQLADIKERVDALMNLRDAMKLQDDEYLAKCMKEVAQLSKTYGTFCAPEATQASQLFNDIRSQLELLDEILSIITSIQKTVDKNNSESCLGKVESDQPLLDDKLTILLRNKPKSRAGIAMMDIFQSIFAIRCSWIKKDWASVASRMKQLHKECEVGVVEDYSKMSPQNRIRVKAWQSAAIREVDLIVVEMDVHYFLPKIMSVWIDADGNTIEPTFEQLDESYNRLQATMSEIKSVGWLGSHLSTLFPLLETALDLKKAGTLDEPEVILGITEGEVTTRQRLKRRNDLVSVFNSEELMEDFSAIKLEKIAAPVKTSRRTSIHFGGWALEELSPIQSETSQISRRHTLTDTATSGSLTDLVVDAPEQPAPPPPTARKSPGGLTGMFQNVDEDFTEHDSYPPPPPPPRRSSAGPTGLPPPPPPLRISSAPRPPPPPPGAATGSISLPPPPPPPRASSRPPPPPSPATVGDSTRPAPPRMPPPPQVRQSKVPPPPQTKHSASPSHSEPADDGGDPRSSPRAADLSRRQSKCMARTRIPLYPPIDSDVFIHRKTLNEIEEIVSSLEGKFIEAATIVKNDIVRTRNLAMERYGQMLLTESIQFGAIQGVGGKLRLDKGSVAGLTKTMKEINELLKGRDFVDPLTAPILDMGSGLLFLRKSILESSFESIVKMHAKGQLDVFEPRNVPLSRIQSIFFQMAKAETAIIVGEASNEWFSRKLSSVLQVGAVRGDVGKIKIKEIGYKEIEDIITMIQTSKEMRGDAGTFSDSLLQLIDFAKCLITLRKAFQAEEYDAQKTAYEALQYVSSACPPIALKEMSFIKKNMLYGESLFRLTNCLSVPSNYSYFIPSTSPTPDVGEVQAKNVVNTTALATTELSAAVDIGDSVVMDVGINSLPTNFQNMLKASRSILRLRQSVVADKWEDADDVLTFIRQKNLLTAVPLIQNEFHAAVEAVDAELVLSVCQSALASGNIATAAEQSEFDTSNVSTEKLDKAIEICLARGCRTKASTVLFKAVTAVRDIRRAALCQDWGTLKSSLQKIKQDKTSFEFPKCSTVEISTVQRVIANEELISQLSSSLLKETIHLHYGRLPEARFISTTGVKIALKDAMNFEKEYRGLKLKNFIEMAELAVQCREGLKSGLWDVVLASAPGLLDCIQKLKDSGVPNKKPVGVPEAKQLRRGSIGGGSVSESTALSTFIATMENEYALLMDYINMNRVETEALHALAKDGLTEDCVGSVENASISSDSLASVQEQLSKLQESSTLSLSGRLSEIALSVNLIKDIRCAILQGAWKRLREIINEATVKDIYAQLPGVSKKEVDIVKSELENREMVENLSTALSVGRLEGEVGQAKFETISDEALEAAIRDCKSVVIKTEEGGCLMYSAMQILRLRQYMLERPTPWGKLKVYASGLLTGQQLMKLHPSTVPEIRLIHSVVVDNVLCKSLTDALVTGNPTGPPGKMDCSEVSVRALETACHEAVLAVNRTEKAEQLLKFCKQFISLRELLQHLDAKRSDNKSLWDTWSSISTIVSEVTEIGKTNPIDAGWLVCRSFVVALSKEVMIQECSASLKESVDAACLAYSKLGKLSLGNEARMSQMFERVESSSLDKIIEHCTEHPESTSLYLDQLLSAVKSLKQLRVMVKKCEWAKVKKYARNRDLHSMFLSCLFCLDEISCAYQEAHNAEIIGAIEVVLNRPFKFSLSLSNEEVDEALLSENLLNDVIRRAESAGVSTVAAQQLLECSEHLLRLRFSIRSHDSTTVHKELRWFKANGHICLQQILSEVELSERLFRNAMAMKKVIEALSIGAAVRRHGALDTSCINIDVLTDALDEARQIIDPIDDLKMMMHVGDLLYGLRYAQKYQDEDAVKVAVDNIMSSHIALHSCAVEEVSEARADVGNKAAVAILTNALKAFRPAGGMVPASGETSSIFQEADGNESTIRTQLAGKAKSPAGTNTPRSSRKHPIARQNSRIREGENSLSDVDPSSAQALEVALQQAEQHGVFSVDAKRLKKTTLFVLSLRYAIEADDWFRVEEILGEHDKKSMTRRKSYIQLVDVASIEIQYVRLQLQVMSSLVILGKYLKSGWANCSNGIVDVTKVIVEPLLDAITKTEHSIFDFDEMKITSSKIERDRLEIAGDGKLEKESVRRLLASAHEIYKIRKHLVVGEISAAAALAEKVLQSKPHAIVLSELQLYYVEIGRALHMMRLCRSLRGSMRLGNVEALEATIFEAQQASMQLSGDLGLVRTLEKALQLYRSIIEAHSYLRSVATGFDVKKIETALESAMKLNMSGSLVDKVKTRLGLLKSFEASVHKLTSSITPQTNTVQIQEVVSQLARASDLSCHPIARRATLLLRLSRDSLRTALLGEAIFSGNCRLASCETLLVRRHYLNKKNMGSTLSIGNFNGYREPENFATRMMLDAQELHTSMLYHSEAPIATSLTKLSPPFAALAVWIFRHCIRAIEEQEYSHPEVILRNILTLGRFSIPMRDEIISQLMKQLTCNPEESKKLRLWLVLTACLEHFTPSFEFEAFVETFLTLESENYPSQSDGYRVVALCISALHESVFKYGYARKISSSWDASLKRMESLLSLKYRLSDAAPDISTEYPSVAKDPISSGSTRRKSMVNNFNRQQSTGHVMTGENTSEPSNKFLHSVSEDLNWGDAHSPTARAPPLSSFKAKSRRMSAIESSSTHSSFNMSNEQRDRGVDFDSDSVDVSRPAPFFVGSFSESFSESRDNTPKVIVDSKLRGTAENWKSRFKLLSDGNTSVTFEEFVLKFRHNRLDLRDKHVLSFMIFGHAPKAKYRKTNADRHLFAENEFVDRDTSVTRQGAIAKSCIGVDVVRRDTSYEATVLKFWDRFVAPFLHDNVVAQPFGGSDEDISLCEVFGNGQQPGAFDWTLYRDLIIGGIDFLSRK